MWRQSWQVIHVEEFQANSSYKVEGQENSGTALELIGTTAQIINSTFVSNRGSYKQFVPWHDTTVTDTFIGGAVIATSQLSTNITISQSKFEDNKSEFGGAIQDLSLEGRFNKFNPSKLVDDII